HYQADRGSQRFLVGGHVRIAHCKAVRDSKWYGPMRWRGWPFRHIRWRIMRLRGRSMGGSCDWALAVETRPCETISQFPPAKRSTGSDRRRRRVALDRHGGRNQPVDRWAG